MISLHSVTHTTLPPVRDSFLPHTRSHLPLPVLVDGFHLALILPFSILFIHDSRILRSLFVVDSFTYVSRCYAILPLSLRLSARCSRYLVVRSTLVTRDVDLVVDTPTILLDTYTPLLRLPVVRYVILPVATTHVYVYVYVPPFTFALRSRYGRSRWAPFGDVCVRHRYICSRRFRCC